jgi:hypothetical protein
MNDGATDEITLPHPVVRLDMDELPVAGADPDWEWPNRTAKPGFRVRIPIAVLVMLLFAAGGLWGGAALQRSHGTTASAGASLANLFRGARGAGAGTGTGTGTGGASSFFGGGGAASAAAAGTVTAVEGDVLYVTTASGSLEKVVYSKTTTVTRTAKSSVPALVPGDTVIVQGTKESNGSVSATSIAATQAGVTAGVTLGG